MNFLQSDLWYHISKEIYKKPTFAIDFMDQKYRGVTKLQHKLGKKFQWFMLHGIDVGDITYFRQDLKDALARVTRDYNK